MRADLHRINSINSGLKLVRCVAVLNESMMPLCADDPSSSSKLVPPNMQ